MTDGKVGNLAPKGSRDQYLMRMDTNGNKLGEALQFGSNASDFAHNMDIAPDGSVHVIGTLGSSPGISLARFDKLAKMKWHKNWQVGGGSMTGMAVRVAYDGDVLIAGSTTRGF